MYLICFISNNYIYLISFKFKTTQHPKKSKTKTIEPHLQNSIYLKLIKMDAPFNEDEMKTSVNSIITYVINGASTKLPIKERDIMQTINEKGKLFNAALQSVKEILKEVSF